MSLSHTEQLLNIMFLSKEGTWAITHTQELITNTVVQRETAFSKTEKPFPFFVCLFFVFLWLIFFLWQFMFQFFSYWIFFSKSNCKYMRLLSHVLGILLITLLWISITSKPHNEVRDDYLSNSVATMNWM